MDTQAVEVEALHICGSGLAFEVILGIGKVTPGTQGQLMVA